MKRKKTSETRSSSRSFRRALFFMGDVLHSSFSWLQSFFVCRLCLFFCFKFFIIKTAQTCVLLPPNLKRWNWRFDEAKWRCRWWWWCVGGSVNERAHTQKEKHIKYFRSLLAYFMHGNFMWFVCASFNQIYKLLSLLLCRLMWFTVFAIYQAIEFQFDVEPTVCLVRSELMFFCMFFFFHMA